MEPIWYSRIAGVQEAVSRKADTTYVSSIAGSLASRVDTHDLLIQDLQQSLTAYAEDLAATVGRVENLEKQPVFAATVSTTASGNAVNWDKITRSTNNTSTRIAFATANGVTGIRLAVGTYIITTAITVQQSYTAWTQWAWRETASNVWVDGSEIAVVTGGDSNSAQTESGALLMRVDSGSSIFSLQLKQQAESGTPDIIAESTQVVIVGLNVPSP
jgi:hypothetical protein